MRLIHLLTRKRRMKQVSFESEKCRFVPFELTSDFEDFAAWNKRFDCLITDLLKVNLKTEDDYRNHLKMVLTLPNREDWTIYSKENSEKVAFLSLSEWIPEFTATIHASCPVEMVKEFLSNDFKNTYIYDFLTRFIQYCFEDLKLKRLGVYIPKSNRLAADVLNKMGFQEEGYLRVLDMKLFSFIDTDYKGG